MSKVFVFAPADGRFNVESAAAYGVITRRNPEGISPFNTDQLTETLSETVDEIEPDSDFVTLTGNNIVVALAVALTLSAYGRVRLLIFDARSSKYVERTVTDPTWAQGDE
tara:strand:+ start:1919 stop:2248 length:330 start_codon:yes stop_codon:yes gene_type:complete